MSAEKVKRMESTAPARVFLIVDPAGGAYGMGDTFPEHGEHVSWDAESCGGVEVEYIRAADVAGLVESVARTIREFERMGEACGAVSILKQRTACESAMVALKAELARWQS